MEGRPGGAAVKPLRLPPFVLSRSSVMQCDSFEQKAGEQKAGEQKAGEQKPALASIRQVEIIDIGKN
ncbi:MAG: hypothetical protein EBZ36_00520 [Acidobacteria bacterium]|nr:hypothetical protein [Acidobacteriota bacterium]